MSDISGAALSSFASKSEVKKDADCAEASRIDDLLLEQINILGEKVKALEIKIRDQDKIIAELNVYADGLGSNQKSISRRITELNKKKEVGKTSKDRARRIDLYLNSRPDHKASYESLRGHLGVNSVLLNMAIAALMKEFPGKYARSQDKNNRRNRWLVEVPRMV